MDRVKPAPPARPARRRPRRSRYVSMSDRRKGTLRHRGYTVTDADGGGPGVWISDGRVCGYFADSAAALVAAARGWPEEWMR